MKLKQGNEGFICENCGKDIVPLTNGSFRNHCPRCLYSKHVDEFPGDRSNKCRSLMKPIGIKKHPKKGYQIIHRCLGCKEEKVNIIAEDNVQSDSMDEILRLVSM